MLETSSPGVIVYHFSFAEPITEATLSITTSTFHWTYSQGHSFVYAATDGHNWIKLAEAAPPEYGGWSAGNFSGSLPQAFIGGKDIYIKVELYSYGESASKGGVYCNTAQYLRYDTNQDKLTFNLEVKNTVLPAEKILPLPTNKTSFPTYQPVVTAKTDIVASLCKPVGVGDIAEDGDNVAIEIKLEKPSGYYDAYLALQAPALDPNEFFMLGQDGIFHPLSQSGLVKWKQASTGNIDEKPFGDFPVSLLPGGTYNFNFMLTPAGSFDAYYLWDTSFSAPDPSLNVPDGSAGFFNGTLVVPNAMILSGGQIYDNSAPVSKDELTTIKKNGKIFFYHPAMGQVELSEDNSKLAVAYFMTGLSTNEINEIKREAIRSSFRTTTFLGTGERCSLKTGVDITLITDDGLVKATNTRRRFALVKTGEDPKHRYLLLPRAGFIPTELFEGIDFIEDLYNGISGETRNDIQAFDKIETFGAFMRLSESARKRIFNTDQQLAIDLDSNLVASLNSLDMAYFILEGTRQVTALFIPTTCSKVFINGICRNLQLMFTALLSGDKNAVWNLKNATVDGLVSDVVECAIQAALVPTFYGAIAMEAADKLQSLIGAVVWSLDAWYETLLIKWGVITAYDVGVVRDGMMAYLQRDASGGVGTEIVYNLVENSAFTVPFPAPDEVFHHIYAMTPNGVLLSAWRNAHPDKIFTTMDWGRGERIDIYAACGADDSWRDPLPNMVDITDSGRLFFDHTIDQGGPNSRSGIYTIMADGTDGHFVPIIVNQDEFEWQGFDNINVEALNVSGDGKVLIFSKGSDMAVYNDHKDRLYAVDPSGENQRELAISNSDIDKIDVSHSGNMVMFDYTSLEGEVILSTVSSNGGTVVDLAKISNLALHNSTAVISPDGNWVAAVAGDFDNTIGIDFIRTDGSDYYWVDTVPAGIRPHPTLPLSFSLDGKTVIFSGFKTSGGPSDICAIDNDRDNPGLRIRINTPKLGETWAVFR